MNYIGNHLKITIFGQSHGVGIGAVVDGCPAGIEVDEQEIMQIMRLRAPGASRLTTPRKEADIPEFLSGVLNGKTCGSPLSFVIYNKDMHSKDYAALKNKPRPSHADYPAMLAHGDALDLRGGGAYSGRLTAPLCVIGAIALKELEKKHIHIGTHIARVGEIEDRAFDPVSDETELLKQLSALPFAVIDDEKEESMRAWIEKTAERGDSVGGVIECKIIGMPAAIGSPMFGGIENEIAKMMFGIPAVKGIEFGMGFAGSRCTGSFYNDSYYFDENMQVKTKTNHAGGIVGGMSTGMPIVFRVAIKPTPSIAIPQETVDLKEKKNCAIAIDGRHDPCIAIRANTVVRAACAIVLWDMLLGKGEEYGLE